MADERKKVIKLTHTKKIGPLSEDDEQEIPKSIREKIKSSKSIKLATADDDEQTIPKSIKEKIKSSKSLKLTTAEKKTK